MKRFLMVLLASLICIQLAACSTAPTNCTHDFSQYISKQEYDALIQRYEAAQNELNTAKANYDTVKSDYDAAKAQYEEAQGAYESIVADLESTAAERDSALTNYETAKAQYDTIKVEYDAVKAEYKELQTCFEALRTEYEALKKLIDDNTPPSTQPPSTPDDGQVNRVEWFYQHDKWNLYKAVKLSDTIIKIENWGRFNAGENGDPFKHQYDICVISTTDVSTNFKWLDESHTAFSVTLVDEENYYMDGPVKAYFSIEAKENAKVLLYQHDKWNLYKAVELSDTIIKIENWGRFNAGENGDPFKHQYDICIISTTDGSTDFKWLDDEHTAFSITIHDSENLYWDKPTVVFFTLST